MGAPVTRYTVPWRERFEAFVTKKTRAAAAAALPPYVTDISNPGAATLAIGNAWTIGLFDGTFHVSPARDPRRPACSLVFVQSADGNTGAPDPASLGGGLTDKHVIYEGLSRVACDAVLAGAETVRGGHIVFSVWHPEMLRLRASLGLPRHPVQIVATLRGLDLEKALLFNLPDIRVVLLTGGAGARQMADALRARPWMTVIPMRASDDLPHAFEQLRSAGIARISCVGGRTLARGLLDAGVVDDVYLTTAPRAGGEPGTPMHVPSWRGPLRLRKHGTGAETGVVFEHVVPA
jgi:riboflavin biosynthesis pyrimidine reductase